MSLETPTRPVGARYAIVAGACLVQFTVIGTMFSYGVFLTVFETEFGWSRTLLSGALSLAFFMMGVLAIAGGRLNDRYGPRIVLGVTGVISSIGWVLMSQITAAWQLYVLFGLLIGAGLATHDVVTLSTVARWFDKRRGLMTGVVKVGTAFGQMSIPPLAALLIVLIGWQYALVCLGALTFVLLAIGALLLKSPPKPQAAEANSPSSGMTAEEAKRSPVLWMLCAIQFLYFPALTTVPLHIVAHGMDLGMLAAPAALLLTVTAGASIAGRLLIGGVFDRIGARYALILCFAPLVVGLAALVPADASWMLYGILPIYGFAHGGFFTVMSPTVAEYFGLRAHGALFGTVLFFGTIGGSIGPLLTGWTYDFAGSYLPAFATLSMFALIGLIIVLMLPKHQAEPSKS